MKDPRLKNNRENAYIKRFVQGRFDKAMRKLEKSDMPQENKDLVKKYIQYHMAKSTRINTIAIYLEYIINFGVIVKKKFKDVNKDDMIKAMIEINNRYSSSTINDYRVYIKGFYKWMNNGRTPKVTSWIKTEKYIPKVRYKDLIFKEDLIELIKYCKHIRDVAIITLLWNQV